MRTFEHSFLSSCNRFDNLGGQFNEDGVLAEWWTPQTRMRFNNRAQCLVNQYGRIKVPELVGFLPDPKINGRRSLSENLCDNGGLRQGLDFHI